MCYHLCSMIMFLSLVSQTLELCSKTRHFGFEALCPLFLVCLDHITPLPKKGEKKGGVMIDFTSLLWNLFYKM